MEETKLDKQNIINKKFYTHGQIWAGPLAGPLGWSLVSCYFVAENLEALGYKREGKRALLIGVIDALAFLGFFIFLSLTSKPAIKKMPFLLLSLPLYVYFGVIFICVRQNPGETIRKYIRNGATRYSTWRVIGIALLSLILSLFLFAIIIGIIAGVTGRQI